MNRLALSLALALALLSSAGCSNKTEAPHPDHDDHAAEPKALGSGIPLEGIRGLTLLQVPEARLEGRWVPGEAVGDENAQALLSSPVKGIVSKLTVSPGQRCAPGTILALVQSPELARLKAQWLTGKAELDRAQAELTRAESLFRAGVGARRDLEAAQTATLTAKAEEEAARLGLEAVGLKTGEPGAVYALKAPGSGSVVAWKSQRGQGVEAGQELGSFQAAQAEVVRLELSQPGPAGWNPGALAQVRHTSGRTWQGRLDGAPTTLTQDTRRLSYRLRLSGAPLPMPGTPLEVRVPLERGVYLPQAALQQLEGRWGVFVVDQGRAVFRPVQRGLEIKDEVLVLDGVHSGATVVAGGAYLLKAYQQKTAQPEGAGHGH